MEEYKTNQITYNCVLIKLYGMNEQSLVFEKLHLKLYHIVPHFGNYIEAII